MFASGWLDSFIEIICCAPWIFLFLFLFLLFKKKNCERIELVHFWILVLIITDQKYEDDTLDMTVWFQLIAAPLISSNTRDQVISWKYDEILKLVIEANGVKASGELILLH